MKLVFNNNSPIYIQLADYVKQDILGGQLRAGDAIPSVRQISAENQLNPQTVLKAVQILIQEDLIEKRRGLGMFVTENARKNLMKKEIKTFKEKAVSEFVRRAKLLQISETELLTMISSEMKEEK